ncbi:MAG: hypothetical protein Q9170_002054 [Blastenia crenularia]
MAGTFFSAVSCRNIIRSYVTSTTTIPATTTRTIIAKTPSVATARTITSKVVATSSQVTATITQTTTSTSTITQGPGPSTVYTTLTDPALPAATEYAQCQPNNILQRGPKGSLYAFAFWSIVTNMQYSTPYRWEDCCIQCATTPGCGIWAYTNYHVCYVPVPNGGEAGDPNTPGHTGQWGYFFDADFPGQAIAQVELNSGKWWVCLLPLLIVV